MGRRAYQGSTLADVTSSTDATRYYYLDMRGWERASLQFDITLGSGKVAVTLEGTVQDDGTADASLTYEDITYATFGVSSALSSAIWVDDTGKLGGYSVVRTKVAVTSTGGAHDVDYAIWAGRSA